MNNANTTDMVLVVEFEAPIMMTLTLTFLK